MTDRDDRFGMPARAFQAARESHGLDSPVFRAGMYVPTRHESSDAADCPVVADPDRLYVGIPL